MSREVKIVGAVAGVNRKADGSEQSWAVELTFEKSGFGRRVRWSEQYLKRTGERFWEDENGWFVAGDSLTAKACDEAVARFTPWRDGS